jgi:hypothetical protein
MRHSTGRCGIWRGEYGAGDACPDTESLPVLRGPAADCGVRHIRGSMRRLRRDGASRAQHGACGSAMEQEEGGRFRQVIASPGLCQLHARSNTRRSRQHRKPHGDIGDGDGEHARSGGSRCGRASPAFWRSDAAAPRCMRSSTARTRSIRRFGPKPANLAGLDWGFQSNSGVSAWARPRSRHPAWRTGTAVCAGTLYRHLVGGADHRRNRRRSDSQTWLPRLASGEVSAAVPATLDVRSLISSGAGVSGALRCLGAADAAFLLAPTGGAWVIVELARAEATVAPMWDRMRNVIDVRRQFCRMRRRPARR